MAASALEIDRLTVRFDGRTVIDGFSLALAHGERAVITGDSGTGKSTVLRCILGFVSSFEGRILVDGESVGASSIWKLRLRMSYVTQEPQLGTERVKDVLERPFRYRANTGLRSNLSRVPELFDRLLLSTDLLDKEMAVLSGGEKQRVAIAAALLLGRRTLLLDEATSIMRGCGLRLARFVLPVFAALLVGTLVPLLFLMGPVLRQPNWLDAQYVIPICGLILGNCLRADIVGVSRFYRSVRDGEPLFLHHLAQGARLAYHEEQLQRLRGAGPGHLRARSLRILLPTTPPSG